MSTAVISFNSDLELAKAVATIWLEEIAATQFAGQPHCVALSGGRITLKLFAATVTAAKARGFSFAGVEFFWADERCVPPTDPESNFAAAERLFFHPLGIAPERIHRILGEEPPEFGAQQAEAEICRLAPLNAEGQPMLDVIFLGMGEDGHVASLFPGEHPVAGATSSVYRVVTNSPKPPPVRITLDYATMAAARKVWVLVSGAGKEGALRESLSPDGRTPLAQVLRLQPHTTIFTDLAPN